MLLREGYLVGTPPSGMSVDYEVEADLFEACHRWLANHPGAPTRRTPRCIDGSNRGAIAGGLASVRDDLPDTPAARAIVEAIEIGLSDGWAAATAAERRLLIELRRTDVARERIAAFFARTSA